MRSATWLEARRDTAGAAAARPTAGITAGAAAWPAGAAAAGCEAA